MNKKRSLNNTLFSFITFFAGLLIGFIINPIISGVTVNNPSALRMLYLAMLIVAYFIHILVHESGHLLFGLFTGYKFSSFRIFSFMWIKQDGKIKLKRHRIAGTAGQCLMTPPDIKDGKLPYVWYNLGGVILNLAVSIPLASGFIFLHEAPFLAVSFIAFFLVGILVALTNGIPIRVTVNNDASNLIDISKSYEALEAYWIQVKIAELLQRGFRLKDMPSEWFCVPSDEAMKNAMVATRGVNACNRLIDEEDFEKAKTLIEHIIEIDSGIEDLHRNLLVSDLIYLELIGERRLETVERLFTKKQKNFMISMKSFLSVLRTEYALALIYEKNFDKAQEIRRRFEKNAAVYPYPQDAEFERKLINIAQAKGLSLFSVN